MAKDGAAVSVAEVIDLEQARRDRTPEPWVGKRELAVHLGCSPRTIERYLTSPRYVINGERIPHRRVFGGPYQFQLGAVDRWLSQVAAS